VPTLRKLFTGSSPSQFLFLCFPPQEKQWDCDKKKVCNLQIFHSNHSNFSAGYLTAALSVRITVYYHMVVWLKNWKGFGRKQSWPNQGIILEFSEKTKEIHKRTSVKRAGVRADIRTEQLPNMGLEHYLQTSMIRTMATKCVWVQEHSGATSKQLLWTMWYVPQIAWTHHK
jgi:hypothetical protein